MPPMKVMMLTAVTICPVAIQPKLGAHPGVQHVPARIVSERAWNQVGPPPNVGCSVWTDEVRIRAITLTGAKPSALGAARSGSQVAVCDFMFF